jgi:hypothetical protein
MLLADSGSAIAGLAFFLVVGIVGLATYFLPTLIALFRQHDNTLAIFMLNFLAGWTFIGYVFAIVWSCTTSRRAQKYKSPSVQKIYVTMPSANQFVDDFPKPAEQAYPLPPPIQTPPQPPRFRS